MMPGNYALATRWRSTFGGSEITLRFLWFTLKHLLFCYQRESS